MPDQAAEGGPAPLRKCPRRPFLIRRLSHLHLDQLVITKGFVDGLQHAITAPGLADEHHRFERVREGTEVPSVARRQLQSSHAGTVAESGDCRKATPVIRA